MKTRNLLAVVAAIIVSAPLFFVACNGDNSQTQDSGPQNNPDAGKDVQQTQDTGTNDVQQTTDGGACLTFDNTLVPGYPNNIPQP